MEDRCTGWIRRPIPRFNSAEGERPSVVSARRLPMGRVARYDQLLVAERLVEEGDGTRSDGLIAGTLLWIGGNEDDRHAMAMVSEMILELEAAQARHLNIRNETRRFVHPVRRQKF